LSGYQWAVKNQHQAVYCPKIADSLLSGTLVKDSAAT